MNTPPTPDLAQQLDRTLAFADAAPGVARIGVLFVNAYGLDAGDGRWWLVDTGLPGFAAGVRAAAEEHFGLPPEAILLTHAHFDHAGNAAALAEEWGVPIWAHRLEMPYLTGGSDYPPGDPTPGGAICQMSRAFPHGGYDLRGRIDLRQLDGEGGAVPGLPGWRWLHTPGHTAGHVSLFRDDDRLLVAGDALATMDLDSWAEQLRRTPEACRPATPFTPDWIAATASVRRLADLEPRTVVAGHGLPLAGRSVAAEVAHLAETMQPPPDGRYTFEPATYDAAGRVASLPPPAPDPVGRGMLIAGGVGAGLLAIGLARSLTKSRA